MDAPPLVTIRDARLDDAEIVVDFNCRLAWETEHKRLDPAVIGPGVAEALRRPEYAKYFIAESLAPLAPVLRGEGPGVRGTQEAVVGQMMITYEWSDWRNGLFWWIQSVYVVEAARRCGVFRALYHHVESLARATPGVIGLRLYVEHENAAALATYRKLGMVPSGHVLYERDWSGATT
jgi:ribosomal protein S18 acetylase RimI-like enzyme